MHAHKLADASARSAAAVVAAAARMTPNEKFLFDLNGFVVVRGVLSEAEVQGANDAIDAHLSDAHERADPALRNTAIKTSHTMRGDGKSGRIDLGGMLGWKAPHCDVFRRVLAHPRLVPYFHELCGEGYRLDHQPFCILSERGAEGFTLHGGPLDAGGNYMPHLGYTFRGGRMYNPLLACAVQLCDHNAGDGGFVIVRGSHKANFPTPSELEHGTDLGDSLYQPVTKAGDVVLFSEGTVHGAMAWNAERQRRVALYRFAPPTIAYGRSYLALTERDDEDAGREARLQWPASYVDGARPEELAVLEPPYAGRLDRPVVNVAAGRSGRDCDDGRPAVVPGAMDGDDGHLQISSSGRPEVKKRFDSTVFKTRYF